MDIKDLGFASNNVNSLLGCMVQAHCILFYRLYADCRFQRIMGHFRKILEILEKLEEMLDVSVIPVLDMTLIQRHNNSFRQAYVPRKMLIQITYRSFLQSFERPLLQIAQFGERAL